MAEDIISEAPEYSTKSEFSKGAITSKAFENCIVLRSVELKEGYYNYNFDREGNVSSKIWVSDSRKNYVEGVEALRILLLPEIFRDEAINKRIKECTSKKKDLFKKYSLEKDGVKYVPEKGMGKLIVTNIPIHPKDSLKVGAFPTRDEKIDFKYYDLKINLYWEGRVEIADELFELLSILVDKLNYFKAGASF